MVGINSFVRTERENERKRVSSWILFLCTFFFLHFIRTSAGAGHSKHITVYQHKIIEFIYGFCHILLYFSFSISHTICFSFYDDCFFFFSFHTLSHSRSRHLHFYACNIKYNTMHCSVRYCLLLFFFFIYFAAFTAFSLSVCRSVGLALSLIALTQCLGLHIQCDEC